VYFYCYDMQEPPHVHVDRDDDTAKFWLTPATLAHNIGFRARELRDIQRTVSERSAEFLEAWNDYFGT
jgi:hypothetical protein